MPDTKLNFKSADTIRMMPLDAAGLFLPFGRPVADYLRGLVGNQNGTRALLKPGASDFSPVIRWSASTAPALRTTGFDQAERAGLVEPAPPEEASDPRVADFLPFGQPGVAARDLNQTRIAIAVPDFWPVSLPRVSALPMRQRMMFGPAPAGRSKLASAPAPKPAVAPSAKSAPAVVPPPKPAVAQPAKPAAPAPPPPPKVASPASVPTKTVTAIPLVTKPAVTAPASPQTPAPASPKISPPPAAAARAPEAPVIASPSPAARSTEVPAPSKPLQATRVSTIDKPAPPPVKPAPVAPPAAKAPATPPASPKTPAPPMPAGRSSSPSPLAAARDTLQQEAPKQKEPEARSRPVADTPRPPARAESLPAAINEPHLTMGANAESGSFLNKIPMAARIVVAILILIVGGYFVFGNSGDKAKPIDPIAAAGENSWGPFEWASDAPGSRRARQMQFYRPSTGMSDYQMQFVGQIESKALGWVFRASDTKNYYAMKIENFRPGAMALTHFAVVDGRESSYSQRPLSIDARPGAAYRVKLDVSGPRFTVYIGGEPVDFWTDNRLKSGAFGFMTERDERGATSSVQFSYPKGQ